MKNDRLVRLLASAAFAMSLVSLGVSMYALSLAERYMHDLRRMTTALEAIVGDASSRAVPMRSPPPTIDPSDE